MRRIRHLRAATLASSLLASLPAHALTFTPGDLVVSIYGNGDGSGPYTDNQAAPIVLQQLTTSGATAGSIVLPQTSTVVNGVTQNAISGEYGSSSEGSLQRSADGKSLVIAGYGVNAAAYNTEAAKYVAGSTTMKGGAYGNAALAQTTSIQGGQYTAVSRVVALIGADGRTDTSTGLYNVYNTNNPRSVATVDGTTFYLGGQGVKGDATQGVFVAAKGASTATAIDTSSEVRTVEIVNGQLDASRDTTQNGKQATITNYGATPVAGATTGTSLNGIGPQIAKLTAAQSNNVNNASSANNRINNNVYLSPENYFFANANTLYIADAGQPKNGNIPGAGVGDGGLQKWVLSGGVWSMAYDIYNGLNLVVAGSASGSTGLIGLTGKVNADGTVSLYATNETIGDLDQTYVYGVSDVLTATTAGANDTFTTLYTAAAGTNVRGITFAPEDAAINVPEPASMTLLGGMLGALLGARRRARRMIPAAMKPAASV